MSDAADPRPTCPVHHSVINPDGKCTWCEIGKGNRPTLPWVLTENDRKFLRSLKIDPEAD